MNRSYSPFLPLLLVVVTLVAMLGFRAYQLELDKQALGRLQASQDRLLKEADQARQEIESLTVGLTRLAAKENANAQAFLEMLQTPRW